ncbi:ALK-EXO [Parapoynx stagnalis nucleopolyhedrovirus]|uniref:ALK-EXO n=1 Tax=Parapoynx stagnalis nucleopolyhedrovirus TaxID=2993413 RepID=A0A9E8BVZ8_9ABAC|nr:ALK-EXO [Parapoynx stagnalis nucleopolyhedrovirus]
MNLTPEQQYIFQNYKFENYIKNILLNDAQLNSWRTRKIIDPPPLTRETILAVELATRGQNKNKLWMELRLDRRTATASGKSSQCNNPTRSPALLHGNAQESKVKSEHGLLFHRLGSIIEMNSPECVHVKDTILDCGMFLSEFGLHSASPDAYFKLSDGTWIPVEIKCPFNYRDTTVDQMRLSLGSRKPRYRVKHTALSVNKSGEPIFLMEEKDTHYRQIQRQMYVMKAPFGFYIVKFKNNLVVTTVYRNEKFYTNELNLESNAFVAFALQNANNFKHVDKRLRSFEQQKCNHTYTPCQYNMLAQQGLYIEYGYLKCAHCDSVMDSREPFGSAKNHSCDKFDPNTFVNSEYFDHSRRYNSLIKNSVLRNDAKSLAYHGWYFENNTIKTFCCGKCCDEENINLNKHVHKNDCHYYINVLK